MIALLVLLVSPVDLMPGPVDDILYIIGMIAVSKEEQWLKESGRTYNEVRTQVDELENRRNIIMQGIQALLKD